MRLKILQNALAVLLFLLILWVPQSILAFSGITVTVEVVKADRSSKVDPELKDLVKDLSGVLNYTGFSLMKKAELPLNLKEKGEVVLSSNRTLELEFTGFEENNARLIVKILENRQETFRTILLLVNHGSVLIGGPPQDGGVLLLRIGGTFRN